MGLLEELQALQEAQPHFVFLDYRGLKAAVESKDPHAALSGLRDELDKVNDVATVQFEVLSAELKRQLRKDFAGNVETLDNLSRAIVQLHSYVSLSYEALTGIVRQCGDQEETASCIWFASKVEDAPFRALSFDALLAQLGQLYATWRKQHSQQKAPWTENLGQGSVQTYFVPKKSTMPMKVALLKRLAPAARQVRIKTTSTTRTTGQYSYDFQQQLSTLYFDSPQGSQYAERYRRSFPAEAGAQDQPRSKLLHCGWVTDSLREVTLTMEDAQGDMLKAQLPHRDMPALLAGTLDAAAAVARDASPEECQQQQATLEAMLATVREQGLRPLVSATSMHYSFVLESDSGVVEVATVDDELIFRREVSSSGRDWCRAAGGKRAEQEFPGVLLQVRLPAVAAEALLGGLETLDLRPIPGFSLALHGTALFHRQLAVPAPPWIPSESLPSKASSFPNQSPRQAAEAKEAPATASTKAPKPAQPAKKSDSQAAAKKAKPEPKLFIDIKTPLASERTVIRWFRSAVLMASLSGLLLNLEDKAANINGLLMGLLVLLFLVLPLRQFLQRAHDFVQPAAKQPKVDRRLPSTLAWILAVILTATLLVEVVM